MSQNGFMISLINQFGDLGGFEILTDLLRTKPEFKCPISIMKHAIKTFNNLNCVGLKEDFVIQTYAEVSELLEQRLSPEQITN